MKSLPPNVVNFPTASTVKRRPGRPRVVRPAPTFKEAEYYDKLASAAESFIGADSVVAASTNGDTSEVARIDAVLRGLAHEQAALLFERLRLQREGRGDPAQVSSRRTEALVKLARLVVAREQMRRADPEPDPQDIATILGMILDDAREVLAEVAPADVAKKFLDAIKARMGAAALPCRTTP